MVRIALLWITWWWVALGLNAGRRWTPCDLQGKLALLGGDHFKSLIPLLDGERTVSTVRTEPLSGS